MLYGLIASFLTLFDRFVIPVRFVVPLPELVERGTEPLRQGRRRTTTVVVQEDNARLLAEHMVVQRYDFQVVLP